MKVGISLLTHNHLKWTTESLRSLTKFTPTELYDLCILDNNSTDGTVKFLKNIKHEIIYSQINVGVAKGRNITFERLLKKNQYDYICIIHNDMIFTGGWLEDMLEICRTMGPRVILGCSNIIGEWSLNLTDEQRENFVAHVKNPRTGQANFEPRIYPKSVFQEVGMFDEQFEMQECEDVDLNIRCNNAGYSVIGTNQVVIFHAYRLVRQAVPNAEQYVQRNQKLLAQKYQGMNWEKYNIFRRTTCFYDGIPFIYHCV